MRLKKVEFIKFKSISKGTLDIEKDITCLVGVNETGKSNILLALEKADIKKEFTTAEYSRHSDDFGNSDNSPEIKLWLEPIGDERGEIQKILGKNEISTIILTKKLKNYRLDFPEIDFEKSSLTIKEDNNEPKNEVIEKGKDIKESKKYEILDVDKQKIRNKVIEEIIKFIPKFLRFDSVDFEEYFLPQNGEVSITNFISNPDSINPVKNLLLLGGISDFKVLQANDGDHRITRDKLLGNATKKINDEILRVVWPIESVEVEITGEGDILKIRLKEKGKTSPFKPGERSRGLQWALAFNIYFLSETRDTLKESVLLIDEPGIFLHINAQNKLLEETFNKIIEEGNQIIYTTHLPFLIDSRFPERIRILEKNDEDTQIGNKAWSESEFGKIPEPVKTALGLRWSELFKLTENNVVVEGPSDQIILRNLQLLFGQNQEINYLPAYGYEKFPSVLANIKIERKKGFGIVDGDIDIEKIRETCRIISIPNDELENIPTLLKNKQILTIEDIIPEDIFKDAIFHVYEKECNQRRNCSLSIDEIPMNFPRVKNLEDFFSNKFKAKKHLLQKMEIVRYISDILITSEQDKTDKKWDESKKLIAIIESKFQQKESKIT